MRSTQTTGTVRLKATFPNTANKLWPGEFVNARVLVQTDSNALTIPSIAVQRGPTGVFTYVVKADSTVEARPLQIGDESDAVTVVAKGLKDGEGVVTSNQYRLQPGAAVRTTASRRRSHRRGCEGPAPDRGGAPQVSISTPFIERPIATSLLMAGIFLVGLVAFPLLPVAPLPQVDFPTIVVTAQLPGASPETMASSVATPLEYQFSEIPGVTQMTSTSVLGTTQITMQFDLGPQHRCGRAGYPIGDRCRRRAVAEEPALAAFLQQGESGGLADPDVVGAFGRAAAHRGGRLRRERHCAADLPHSRASRR